MLTKTWSAAIQGIDAITIEVEVNATEAGTDTIVNVVGLPDAAVRESRERVWSALNCNGFYPPPGRTTINLAPADIRKEGAAFDLPIALGLVATTRMLNQELLRNTMVVGELALDGRVRPVQGALPVAILAKRLGIANLLVPAENASEAAMVEDIRVFPVAHLREAVGFLAGQEVFQPVRVDTKLLYQEQQHCGVDFSDIKGQTMAKRAMEVAAAGGHNSLMIGPPGSGKTMLASRIASILPPLTLDEAMDVTRIHSIAGCLPPNKPLIVQRPFRTPHHTVSDVGLIGGQSTPKPGEISLAHNGVLFLDELPEFKRNVLEVLRQPLESGKITISRAKSSCTFPANFMLIAAMNPCPCGHYGGRQRQCRCGQGKIQQYRARISGPLLDRIDIHTEVAAISENELIAAPSGEPSSVIRKRVLDARSIQFKRFRGKGLNCNADMTPAMMQDYCKLDGEGEAMMRNAIRQLDLSARAYDRILKLARTIADLEGFDDISSAHISEAIQHRSLDRRIW